MVVVTIAVFSNLAVDLLYAWLSTLASACAESGA